MGVCNNKTAKNKGNDFGINIGLNFGINFGINGGEVSEVAIVF